MRSGYSLSYCTQSKEHPAKQKNPPLEQNLFNVMKCVTKSQSLSSQNPFAARRLNELKAQLDEVVGGRLIERLGVAFDSGNLRNLLLLGGCIRKHHS